MDYAVAIFEVANITPSFSDQIRTQMTQKQRFAQIVCCLICVHLRSICAICVNSAAGFYPGNFILTDKYASFRSVAVATWPSQYKMLYATDPPLVEYCVPSTGGVRPWR